MNIEVKGLTCPDCGLPGRIEASPAYFVRARCDLCGSRWQPTELVDPGVGPATRAIVARVAGILAGRESTPIDGSLVRAFVAEQKEAKP